MKDPGKGRRNSIMKKILNNWSEIRQKGESQNDGNKKTKPVKFSEKLTFLTP